MRGETLRQKYPWLDSARAHYEAGHPLKPLAAMVGMSDSGMRALAQREGWDREAHLAARNPPPGHRECLTCRETKPLDDFGSQGAGAFRSHCKACRKETRDYGREYEGRQPLWRLRVWQREGRLVLSRPARKVRTRFREHLRRVEAALQPLPGYEPIPCARCAGVFTPTSERHRYCSDPCNWRAQRSRRRARERVAYVENVDLADIYARDGGVCQICHERVDRRCRYPHPRTPVLDHIVPLARGGLHESRNVQLAHHGCNNAKNARAVGSQLRLVG